MLYIKKHLLLVYISCEACKQQGKYKKKITLSVETHIRTKYKTN